jgi:hypothetical protein
VAQNSSVKKQSEGVFISNSIVSDPGATVHMSVRLLVQSPAGSGDSMGAVTGRKKLPPPKMLNVVDPLPPVTVNVSGIGSCQHVKQK